MYNLDYSNKKQVIIKIGELYVKDEHAIIHTVLGTYVAVCIYDDEKNMQDESYLSAGR